MSSTEKIKKEHAKCAALSPVLKTKDKKIMKVSFKISTKYIGQSVLSAMERYFYKLF